MIKNRYAKYYLFTLIITVTISVNSFGALNNSEDDSTIVQRYGQLSVAGNKIVDKNSSPAVLHGMSFFWSMWMPQFYNYDCVKWLRDDWKCTVVRAAMGIEGGYLSNPTAEKNRIKTIVESCIDLGIYVIIDWHDHNAQNHLSQSIQFFKEMATLYGDKPNVIYEIFNEPLNTVTWNGVVKPYADSVVKYIREIDPDNLILVGSPTWSQDVDIASQNPLQFNNIAYTLHFYAATHKASLRSKAKTALNNGIALFVSEFGTSESSGTGKLDSTETDTWLKFMKDNYLGWCNWSVADKVETSAALKPGASGTGGWAASVLTASGTIIRNRLIAAFSDTVATGIELTRQPMNFELYQNYPNPFNPATSIEFEVSKSGQVILDVYDINGKKVKTLINEYKGQGKYKVDWNGTNESDSKVSSGVYFFRLNYANQKQIKKGILLN